MFSVTCVAPVNIALIKYWGKRNEDLILPINDSVSMTLSTTELCTKTTITASKSFYSNKMWLNGEEVPFEENTRISRCLNEVHRLAICTGSQKIPLSWKIHVESFNNFPTAAGLASSAAGYACLVYSLACLYGISLNDQLTTVARQGSGSACRSLYGGFVQWHRGNLDSGCDSVAKQVVSSTFWSNMHVVILVVNDQRKNTGSTLGMQRSVQTSQLIQHRADKIVPERVNQLKSAIQKRDFDQFAKITMRESNQFHAIAMDTYPPCVYMNEISHAIVSFVHDFNELMGSLHTAYTFDAGPNACLYVLEENIPKVIYAINKAFPNDLMESSDYIRGISLSNLDIKFKAEDNSFRKNMELLKIQPKNALKYIIHTKVGDGPRLLRANAR
ncbi:hypothetical protein KR074_002918 [Drosophila pseudoananassae]|nr:hypothetical protein KR074_002918 [Drosophila pseudoananassae]